MAIPTCPICQAQDWDTGIVESGGFPSRNVDSGTYYKSFNKKFIAPTLHVEADVCLQCGHVVLYVDPKVIKKSLKKNK